jgi:hypothetical protein
VLNMLRSDLGRASVNSVRGELTKLDLIRKIGLPVDLFADWSPQELEACRQRVAVEAPFAGRRGLRYTACFNLGDALNRTVLWAFTLMGSPVRGLRALRAFILRTVKVPKLGKVNLPDFFSSRTMATIRSPTARVAAAPDSSADSRITDAIKALDIVFLTAHRWVNDTRLGTIRIADGF